MIDAGSLKIIKLVVPATTYNTIEKMSNDLGFTFDEVLVHVINDGLYMTNLVTDNKIIKMLEEKYDVYHSNFVAGMERHHQIMHEAIENGTDISVADDAYYAAESYNEKALVVSELIHKARKIMRGK